MVRSCAGQVDRSTRLIYDPVRVGEERQTCVFVELTSGDLSAFDFYDRQLAEQSYSESRTEWNEGRSVVFYLRAGGMAQYTDEQVAHLELTSREDAETRGAFCFDAVIR